MKRYDAQELKDALRESARWVQQGLSRLNMRNRPLSRLPSLASYSLESGGKRLRPFLVHRGCMACGGDADSALGAACAVEMIHTYSLIHDDLPSMDDDDLRRGEPTLHRVAGAGQALLAGDILLVEAFEAILDTPVGPLRKSGMAGLLARAAGPRYLVGGQYMDMFPGPDAGEEWVRTMILGKTAAMIRVSLQLGAMVAGLEEKAFLKLADLGNRLGYLFQLTDDILDRCGSEEEMGKGVSKDSDQGKFNPVSILGLEGAFEKARNWADSIAGGFMELPGEWDLPASLALYLPDRRS